jgi:aspartyl/glutamyl-tRNA(Asn/Gln) amidotransferase C subunit
MAGSPRIKAELLAYLTELARLNLNSAEEKELASDLNKILKAFSGLKKIKTGARVNSDLVRKFSDIKTRKAQTPELANELLESAPDKRGRYIRVPKVGRTE